MALTNDQKTRIEEIIKDILLSRLESFPDQNAQIRNAPFHQKILEAFREKIKPLNLEIPYLVAISSWMHGLNTSLGTGYENLAHIISGGYKRKFTGAYVLKVKRSQGQNINEVIINLKAGSQLPNLQKENDIIFDYDQTEEEVNALGFTADNYLENENLIEAIEMKSVRPNSGEGRGEKEKILFGKASLKLTNPTKDIKFFIGFPFDPTADSPTEYNKERFFDYLIEFKKFFDPEEVLIGSELWDHLSGSKNTMEEILDIISETVKRTK